MRIIFSSFLIFLFSIIQAFGQDLGQILEAHYKAASQEKMMKVETQIVTGTNKLLMAGIESKFTVYQARPNMVRAEGQFQGSRIIQTYNGVEGWMYAPTMGIPEPTEMKGEELTSLLNQAEFENDLWDYEAKGSIVEIEGRSGDNESNILKHTSKGGVIQYFHINTKSNLITLVTTSQVMGGSETEIEIVLEHYKTVKGIPVAHTVTSKMNGQVVTTTLIEKVEFNKKLDKAIFEKPGIE